MADPLSTAAGIAGLISLAIQTTQGLVEFYTAYKNQYPDVARTAKKLESLTGTFQFLHDALQNRKFRKDERPLIDQVESSIQQCSDLIHVLQNDLRRFQESPSSDLTNAIKNVGRRAAYPFKNSTLQKLDEDVGEMREDLALALEVLQLEDHKITQDDINEVRSILEVVRAAQISSTIREWLNAPDATVNHTAACAKHYQGTGTWFVKGSIFGTWLLQQNSFLWVNGFAGCGKSVLCSTAIQHAYRRKHHDTNMGIAFFYFTFSDESKQDESAMLRALLLQLAAQLGDGTTFLARLYESSKMSPPAPPSLMEYLRTLIQKFNHVYVLVDALDESPRHEERGHVLSAINTIRQWNLKNLHLLVTSRDEPDIRESLKPAHDEEVLMNSAEINQDISNFISGYLKTELLKWTAYHDRIQKVLSERAQGVFRWVECQFDALKRCPRSESHLNRCLESLPRNLDKTYERMLCNIDIESAEEARRLLTLLCFSARPLKVSGILDAIAVNVNDPVGLDRQSRLQDAESLLEICPGLITFNTGDEAEFYDFNERQSSEASIRIAHFSVQEYLESDRIRLAKASSYALSRTAGHIEIAQICCAYLLDPELFRSPLSHDKLIDFPLAGFAAEYWFRHYRNAASAAPLLEGLALKLLDNGQETFHNWARTFEYQRVPAIVRHPRSDIASPLYYASLLGLDRTLVALLGVEQVAESGKAESVNAQGGHYGNALQAAAFSGHKKVVQMLLDAGAEVNAQGGRYGSALQAAAFHNNNNEKVVQMLLEVGAEVNAQGGRYGNALQAAVLLNNNEKVVQMLLDAGAEVNAQGGHYGNALQAAAFHNNNNEKVVQMLLEVGAKVNAQGGRYGNALQAAALLNNNEKVVQMLLDAGAEVNAQGGHCGNALQAAAFSGHEKVVQMLRDAGAEVNAYGGP